MTAQIALDGMPTRLFSCTPARLNAWQDCPRRYRLQYVDRVSVVSRPWAHLSLGSSVHSALAAWWQLPADRRTVTAAGALVVRKWSADGFRDAAQSDEWQTRAREMVESYLAGVDPLDEPVGVERTVAVKTGALAVSGRVDRIDLRDGEAVVVDYKTGRHVLTTDDARGSLALALYAAATARTLRRHCRRVELHHLPTGQIVVWEHTEESLARQLRRAEDIAEEVLGAEEAYRAGGDAETLFPARVSALCSFCDHAAACPAAAGVRPRDAWDALPDLTAEAAAASGGPERGELAG
ncbi:MAG: putative RecB family exonuclease [Frankiaceae bacterium]|jgi:RecB family exonuclease|nr:putative RecB family exonuclease [Frankiaceae bacterium]MDQ1726297.1 putative RecB family exonuclease [Frankiaceae bacterium]